MYILHVSATCVQASSIQNLQPSKCLLQIVGSCKSSPLPLSVTPTVPPLSITTIGWLHVRGLHVRGLHVRGLHVRGLHVRGLHVRGLHVRGLHVRGLHVRGLHVRGLHVLYKALDATLLTTIRNTLPLVTCGLLLIQMLHDAH